MPLPSQQIKQMTVLGLDGHWHKDLDLPCGYQHFEWWSQGSPNAQAVCLNDPKRLLRCLGEDSTRPLRLYTQHEIFYDQGVLKHTRSSPNWEGGLVTYATCKHLMRTYDVPWQGAWIGGLCPAHCEDNCLLFVGKIDLAFESNYDLSEYVREHYPLTYKVKFANTNPRGDLYQSLGALEGDERYDHRRFAEPPNHTRSLEQYKKSPGSTSDRWDNKIPKWWRDIEYVQRGTRPPSFILSPCWLFSRPLMWTTLNPRRAALSLTCGQFAESLGTKRPR